MPVILQEKLIQWILRPLSTVVAYVVAVNGDNMLVNEGGITTIIRNQETNEIEKIPYNGNGIFYNNNMPISKKRNEFTYLLGFIYLIDELFYLP